MLSGKLVWKPSKKKVDKVQGNGCVNHFFTFGMCLACVSTVSIVPVPVLLRATKCKNLEKTLPVRFSVGQWNLNIDNKDRRSCPLHFSSAYPNWCLPASLSAQMIILVISRGPFICCPFLKTNWSHLETLQNPLGIFGRHQCRYDDHISIAWLRTISSHGFSGSKWFIGSFVEFAAAANLAAHILGYREKPVQLFSTLRRYGI